MKAAIRFVTRRIVNATKALACDTYGDTASLSPGPCERCVGRSVQDGVTAYTTTTSPEVLVDYP